ncbi:autotransporter outer membrane beta-barrel domain-containing protein [Microvirga sp. W0021]|uniref:Autotransporter outer membrane beta-barrel domain-containing protein n=1 Tax=Hohaiivirga grylli TaxID=3133970 RepID=A0ABV0BJ71_9HYPH
MSSEKSFALNECGVVAAGGTVICDGTRNSNNPNGAVYNTNITIIVDGTTTPVNYTTGPSTAGTISLSGTNSIAYDMRIETIGDVTISGVSRGLFITTTDTDFTLGGNREIIIGSGTSINVGSNGQELRAAHITSATTDLVYIENNGSVRAIGNATNGVIGIVANNRGTFSETTISRIVNNGSVVIQQNANYTAYAVGVSATAGLAEFTNSVTGTIIASGVGPLVRGVYVSGSSEHAVMRALNEGYIETTGTLANTAALTGDAAMWVGQTYTGSSTKSVTVENTATGTIIANGPHVDGIAAYTSGSGPVTVTNAGTVMATGLDADGIKAYSIFGSVLINITGGTVTGGSGTGSGIRVRSHTSRNTEINIGAGATVTAASGIAIFNGINGLSGNIEVNNAGTITGNLLLGDNGRATVVNQSIITGIVDLGAGNNTLTNEAGSTITGNIVSATGYNIIRNSGVIDGDIALGSGNNNTTLYAGSSVINVSGTTGVNNVTVMGDALFTFLDGGIGGGADTLSFDGATHTLSSASDVDHFEVMNLVNGSVITTSDLIKMTDTAGGVGAISIDATSTLAIQSPSGYELNHALSGTGVISAQMNAGTDAFNFGSGAGSAFAGTLQMGQGTFALSGLNTTALTNATLQVDVNSVTTVGTGNQVIGGLTFNGGTMIFDATAPAQIIATSYITAGKLDISGTGTVQVNLPDDIDNSQPLPSNTLPLLQHDDITAMTKLVSSANVNGTGGALALVDQSGVVISNAQILDIDQNGVKVAEGTYDYRLLSASDGLTQDGLYIGYGLKLVNLIGTGNDALVLVPAIGATGLAADLSAQLTGSGDLAIAAGAGQTVSLSNTLNDYSGITTVQTGTLAMAVDNALGLTSILNVSANAGFDSAGYSQTVGALNTGIGASAVIASGSTFTISDQQRAAGNTEGGLIESGTLSGGGTVVIDSSIVSVNGAQAGYTGQVEVEGGSELKLNAADAFNSAQGIELAAAEDTLIFGDLSGTNATWTAIPNGTAAVNLSGAGRVELRDGSDVTLSGDSTAFTGQFDIAAGTALRATEAKNLGTASILAEGTFNAIADTDWQLGNAVTGTGTVLKTGTGSLTVDQALSGFTGLTSIEEGTLVVGYSTMSTAFVGGNVSVASGGTLAGNGTIDGDVINTGTISALNALPTYSTAPASNFTINGVLTNSGTVQLGGSAIGNTITVGGLVGQGGNFVLHTALANDSSATDQIIIDGGTVTGSNFVSIVNQGGLGAQTTGDGIQVVVAQNGATTAAGSFTLSSRVAAGAYEYSLLRGGLDGSGEGWYLRTPPIITPETPSIPLPSSTDGLRPEVPTNAAIAPLASEFGYAMLGTLHERSTGAFISSGPVFEERKVKCKDASQNYRCVVRVPVQGLTDSQRFVTAGWARIFADKGEKSRNNFVRSGADYGYTLGGVQVGLDVYANEQADGTLDKAGVYVGYGQVSGKVRDVSDVKAGSVDLDATSVGAYWTHYAASGWYTDAVVQGTWYSAETRSVRGEQTKPDGFGFMASIEGGYSFKPTSDWVVEPQAQLIYQNVTFNDTNDNYGIFHFQNSDSLRGRLGVRVAHNWNMGSDTDQRLVTAWMRANVWHEFKGDYKTMVTTLQGSSPYQTTTALGGTWGEIGAGGSAQVTDSINLFMTGAYQHSLDNKGRQSWNGRLGVNMKW